MSVGQVAGLIAACALLILVGLLAVPLIRLNGVLRDTRRLVNDLNEQAPRLLDQAQTTVRSAAAAVDRVDGALGQVDTTLARVDSAAAKTETVAGNAATLSGLLVAAFARPLVRIAALTYGVRTVLAADRDPGRDRRAA